MPGTSQSPDTLCSVLPPPGPQTTNHSGGQAFLRGFNIPSLAPQQLQGDLDRQSQIYFTSCSGPTVRFYPSEKLWSSPCCHIISWRRITDQKNTTKFSLQSQQTYKVIISPKGPKLCPQHQLLCAGLLSLSSALQKLWQISCPWQTPRLPQRQGILDFTATAFLPLTLNLL